MSSLSRLGKQIATVAAIRYAPSQQPLADAGGVVGNVHSQREPYEVLDDLMAVVEALCPTWPSRGGFVSTGKWLL
jgi:hypothetical protein